jgi:hypothetical protein
MKSERVQRTPKTDSRGMDIHEPKQRTDASGKKLTTLGNEYIKSKDEIAARKVPDNMLGSLNSTFLLQTLDDANINFAVSCL